MKEKDLHPWADFLDARKKLIDYWHEEKKKSDSQIASDLSMSEMQVYQIRTYPPIDDHLHDATNKELKRQNEALKQRIDDLEDFKKENEMLKARIADLEWKRNKAKENRICPHCRYPKRSPHTMIVACKCNT